RNLHDRRNNGGEVQWGVAPWLAGVQQSCCLSAAHDAAGVPGDVLVGSPNSLFSWPGFSDRDGMTGLIYFLFFCSGLSGLIYQVVWVRVFGNVFGNTVYSASLVIAVFMLGLGAGSYAAGRWSDRRYATNQEQPLRVYGFFELMIAALGAAIALILPHLDR